jgi:hypothetical protein
VEIVGITPNLPTAEDVVNVQLRIHNQGTTPITTSFWVDLYVNPPHPPVVNEPWTEQCRYGSTWLVEGLEAEEVRILESRHANPSYSNLLRLPYEGEVTLYALADSYGQAGVGTVEEQNEENNLSSPFSRIISP